MRVSDSIAGILDGFILKSFIMKVVFNALLLYRVFLKNLKKSNSELDAYKQTIKEF